MMSGSHERDDCRQAGLPVLTMPGRLDDFYDVPPPEVVLLGGYYDGKRMRVPVGRDSWLMPPPPEDFPDVLEIMVNGPQFKSITDRVLLYRWTGSIRDDGTRVFQFCP